MSNVEEYTEEEIEELEALEEEEREEFEENEVGILVGEPDGKVYTVKEIIALEQEIEDEIAYNNSYFTETMTENGFMLSHGPTDRHQSFDWGQIPAHLHKDIIVDYVLKKCRAKVGKKLTAGKGNEAMDALEILVTGLYEGRMPVGVIKTTVTREQTRGNLQYLQFRDFGASAHEAKKATIMAFPTWKSYGNLEIMTLKVAQENVKNEVWKVKK